MLRAVPSMVLMALSRLVVFKSGILVLAISSILAREIVPTFSRFGLPEPLGTPAAFFKRSAAGGVLVSKVKERSAKTVMTTGIFKSGSICAVLALNALQNSMMLTPCWPSAGPMGGAGLAFPAGTWSLI